MTDTFPWAHPFTKLNFEGSKAMRTIKGSISKNWRVSVGRVKAAIVPVPRPTAPIRMAGCSAWTVRMVVAMGVPGP